MDNEEPGFANKAGGPGVPESFHIAEAWCDAAKKNVARRFLRHHSETTFPILTRCVQDAQGPYELEQGASNIS
jgi:hypothetical protein